MYVLHIWRERNAKLTSTSTTKWTYEKGDRQSDKLEIDRLFRCTHTHNNPLKFNKGSGRDYREFWPEIPWLAGPYLCMG